MIEIVVVDTNIIISILLSGNRRMVQILFGKDFQFIAPKFIIVELFKHAQKVQEATKFSESKVLETLSSIINRIKFYDEILVSLGSWAKAFELCRGVDEKDTPYVALALEFEAKLWTNDKQLKIGLERKGFSDFFRF